MPKSTPTIYEQLTEESVGSAKSILAKLIRAQFAGEVINIEEARKRLKNDLEVVHIARSKWSSLSRDQLERLGWYDTPLRGQTIKFITNFKCEWPR